MRILKEVTLESMTGVTQFYQAVIMWLHKEGVKVVNGEELIKVCKLSKTHFSYTSMERRKAAADELFCDLRRVEGEDNHYRIVVFKDIKREYDNKDFRFSKALLEDTTLSHRDKFVFSWLLYVAAGSNDWFRVPYEHFNDTIQFDLRNVKKIMRKLEDKGYIERIIESRDSYARIVGDYKEKASLEDFKDVIVERVDKNEVYRS